jgi:glycosyltransferase involved in cell wall biosynthesis
MLYLFNNYQQLSEILLKLFDDPELMNDLKDKAYEFGKRITWPEIGKEYVGLCEAIYNKHQVLNNTN